MGEERAAKMEAVRADGRQPFAARMRGLPEEKVIADFVETGRGPARGVMKELCRIDASGMLQLSPALAARCDAHGWRLEHLGVTIGTVIHGPDLRVPQTEQEIETMYDVLLERKVIFFREQDLTLDQHRDFGLKFGSLEVFPFATPPLETHPEILPISSGPGSPTGASNWHSDVTWRKSPSLGSMLYCEEGPPFGGETGFADTYATFQGLSEKDREFLRGKTCIHDFGKCRQPLAPLASSFEPQRSCLRADAFRFQQGRSGVSEETVEELRSSYPVARHPMVRTHPDTGGEMLYVNSGFVSSQYRRHLGCILPRVPSRDRCGQGKYVEGMEAEESDALLARLYAQAENPEYQCFFRYEAGSLAFWDNRSCMHRALSDSYPHTRKMRRVTIQGSEPYYDPQALAAAADAQAAKL
eukprot:COSAG04_NODE_753_length_10568_cov_1.796733_5_plen_413_part_00